jgi:hypothetical protein
MLEYLISLSVFILALLPMLGINIEYKKIKAVYLRSLFVVLVVVGFIIYTISFFERQSAEKEISESVFSTSDMVDRLQAQLIAIELKNSNLIQAQEEIQDSLTSLRSGTSGLLEDINESKSLYRRLNYYSRKNLEYTQNEILERKPLLRALSGDMKFKLAADSTSYRFEYLIRNRGKRLVRDVEVEVLLLMSDSTGVLSSHKYAFSDLPNGLSASDVFNGLIRNIDQSIFDQMQIAFSIVLMRGFDSLTNEEVVSRSASTWSKDDQKFFTFKKAFIPYVNHFIENHEEIDRAFEIKE